MNKSPMTPKGFEVAKKRLEALEALRPIIAEKISVARDHGDLKENAEYHAAREEQGLCEAQIRDLTAQINTAQVIDPSKLANDGKVRFGHTVTLSVGGAEKRYQIVGEVESDIELGKIAYNSPIANKLLGKAKGDVVTVQTPGGDEEYEILETVVE